LLGPISPRHKAHILMCGHQLQRKATRHCCKIAISLKTLVKGSMSEIAFHEKAGRSQVDSVVLLLDKGFFSAESPPLSPPFHSHSSMSDFIRSVQVGCSRFSRCCHLIVDLSSISRWNLGQAIDAVTGTRLWAFAFPF
jgi:hypothetical protein